MKLYKISLTTWPDGTKTVKVLSEHKNRLFINVSKSSYNRVLNIVQSNRRHTLYHVENNKDVGKYVVYFVWF